GQRALLLRTPAGNVLWDCVSLIDEAMVEIINALGGLKAIAISHPHYYTTMVDWSAAFGGIPVYLHAADKKWIMRFAPCLRLWEEDSKEMLPGLTLIRVGGHFEGGTVLHWAQGASGKGALLSGDLLQVTLDRKFVSFMWSYPNYIPLGEKAVRAISKRLEPWTYETIYGAFWDRVIPPNRTSLMPQPVERQCEAGVGRATYRDLAARGTLKAGVCASWQETMGQLFAVVPDIRRELPISSDSLPDHDVLAGDLFRRRPLRLQAESPDLARCGWTQSLDVERRDFRIAHLLRHAFPHRADRGAALHHGGAGRKRHCI